MNFHYENTITMKKYFFDRRGEKENPRGHRDTLSSVGFLRTKKTLFL